ncbi:para-aminobenzoate synthetase component 1 [Mucilaginibacter frigoritolerans]|uniref:Para-aminobenzoate synthetase component 1 n=1 Tax=Mucilaginibacter frigoritolerans TaxID=652788 RepID=A0A562UBA6_9SPHI|nr:anthranilate synthase component I family protein [Mucilaginibacter frigoritolerans]TWJ02501.1 para-aminobenzoate synthetase component 1 [Mucilaginibacter frigoritolerans]
MIKRITNLQTFKKKALQWASSFNVFCYLDSNNFTDSYSKFDVLIAVDAINEVISFAGAAYDELETFRKNNAQWITGFLGYDLKNETENLTSQNIDHLNFPDLYFFAPKYLILIKGNEAEIIATNPAEVLACIEAQKTSTVTDVTAVNIYQRFSKTEYITTIEEVKAHINRGDIYVTNFCQEFFAENATIDPLAVFSRLNEISPNPFGSFFKWKHHYILCASPERFLAKRGTKLISQPIKGTAKRGKNDEEDKAIKNKLSSTVKELQENVMVVDLVRNDLTKSAKQGTVQTEELFGIYSFKQVHQMISTVVCELDENITPIQAIKNTFPMGSMTGAPKISAMQLMEYYERSRRGVYSGAIGYFNPDDDFDFNVVIRSLLYNKQNKYLSFQAGSAITYHADAESEYEECLLKVRGIMEALNQPESSPPSAH